MFIIIIIIIMFLAMADTAAGVITVTMSNLIVESIRLIHDFVLSSIVLAGIVVLIITITWY
jgi:hypothetical protein